MTTPGFAGKILLVNLTTRQISALDSAKYEMYGGGHGTGTALFWDLCVAPGGWDLQDAFDPRNIVALMTGPLAGIGARFCRKNKRLRPGGADLADQLVRPQQLWRQFRPHAQACRMGRRSSPGKIGIARLYQHRRRQSHDRRCQLRCGDSTFGKHRKKSGKWRARRLPSGTAAEWQKLGNRYSTQRPSIVTIGPAGENKSRIASLVHAGGSGAGQGGFGGVFGSKNLKAIAVIGTGSIKIANPKAVLEAREWFEAKFPMSGQRGPARDLKPGVSCCMGCNRGCHSRSQIQGVDSDSCTEMVWYSLPSPPYKRTPTSDMWKATDAVQKLGLNASDLCFMGAASFPGDAGA